MVVHRHELAETLGRILSLMREPMVAPPASLPPPEPVVIPEPDGDSDLMNTEADEAEDDAGEAPEKSS